MAHRSLRLRLWNAVRRRQLDRDLDDELSFHIEAKTHAYIAAGMPLADARRAAHRQFGNATYLKETSRQMFGFGVETVLADIRYALRGMRRNPGFAAAAVFVLALGLGANTAIFSVVNGALLDAVPYPDPGRLVFLYERNVVGEEPHIPVSGPNFYDWQESARSFEQIAATGFFGGNNLSGPGIPAENVDTTVCTGNLFSVLRVAPVAGRPFTLEDDRPEAAPVAIISYGLWQRRFGGERSAIGRQVRLDNQPFTIVGVLPPYFAHPTAKTQVWLPLQRVARGQMRYRGNHWLTAVGRLKPGVEVAQARAELDTIAKAIYAAYPDSYTGKGGNVVSMRDRVTFRYRTSLLVLLGAVGCVLLIACVNVGNLLLARASSRRRELAVRAALGAGRGRILRQLLTEVLVLSLAGAAAGLGVAYAATRLLASRATMLPPGAVRLDVTVLAFTSALAVLAAVAAVVVPALEWRHPDLTGDLKESRTATSSRSRGRFRDALIAAQFALSLVLLIGAGLLLRSFAQLRGVDPGFSPNLVLTMGINLPGTAYRNNEARVQFYTALLSRLRSLPGVRSASLVSNIPLNSHWSDSIFTIEGRPPRPSEPFDAVNIAADAQYFRTMGIPLVRGRLFTAHEARGTDAGITVISRSMARQFWRDENPVGQYIGVFGKRFQVIGVVGDVSTSLQDVPEPIMYFPLHHDAYPRAFAVVRTAGPPGALAGAVQAEIAGLDRNLAVFQVMTMDDLLARSVSHQGFSLTLLGIFAVLALVLAAVGLYGVIGYAVAQRTPEIGIRIALGANRGDVVGMVLLDGLRPALAGVALGLPCAAAATCLMRTMLYETSPFDAPTFAILAVALLAVAALATLAPAFRAARVDPAFTMRNE